MTQALRTTFLLHAFVALAFGLVMYLVPVWFATIIQWTPVDPLMTSFVGAALLALGVSSLLGYRAAHWEDVRILVIAEAVFTVTGTVTALYYLLFVGAPLFAWVPAVLWGLFAVAWIGLYVQATHSAPQMAGAHKA